MLTLTTEQAPHERNSRRILGVKFFNGSVADSIAAMRNGGLLVAPAAPGLIKLKTSQAYREALQKADVCLADSGFMVMIWNWLQGEKLSRISGLTFMRRLLDEPGLRTDGDTFWIMSSQKSKEKNLRWLTGHGVLVSDENVCVAPMYGETTEDSLLVERLNKLRPRHIIVTLGGGTQEPLGLHLKQNLQYRPAIYCTGAALGFMSGDQVRIPAWMDRRYLGSLLRCLSNPWEYLPRYWKALSLFSMMLQYRGQLPSLSK